jgi:hypothetical protein
MDVSSLGIRWGVAWSTDGETEDLSGGFDSRHIEESIAETLNFSSGDRKSPENYNCNNI